ncbi:DUF5655 domain-containing protein [Kytococcus sedentarius]|uniref:DUF5655 domain-containing protein n=1 Tax=Kytococcus sedentarius TaxID=1276 RepID=UPI0038797F8C
MSDLKLFRIDDGKATELPSQSLALERSLQRVIETNMETLFGVRFVDSEYSTGVRHGGRMDSIGLDENDSPVIFEYKRATNENVINQGLFYLDWLMDHQGDFTMLVQRTLGHEAAEAIDWSNPRLICVAAGFTKYDEYAVQQINRSIELVRYRDFEGELLALELVGAVTGTPEPATAPALAAPSRATTKTPMKTAAQLLEQASPALQDLHDALTDHCLALGDDVTQKQLKHYVAFRRLKNFACVEVHPQNANLLVYLKVDPDTVALAEGFTRDMRGIGHFGTGELEVRIRSAEDLERAKPLLERSYESS